MALSREETARRYGTAIFDFAQDTDKVADFYKELTALKQAAEAEPRFVAVLSDPVLKSASCCPRLSKAFLQRFRKC